MHLTKLLTEQTLRRQLTIYYVIEQNLHHKDSCFISYLIRFSLTFVSFRQAEDIQSLFFFFQTFLIQEAFILKLLTTTKT